jgi:hypothetical protein
MISDLPAHERGLARAVKDVFHTALDARDLDPVLPAALSAHGRAGSDA